jgi:hypothetical protein
MFAAGDLVEVDVTAIQPGFSTFTYSAAGKVIEVIEGDPLRYKVVVTLRLVGERELVVDADRVKRPQN